MGFSLLQFHKELLRRLEVARQAGEAVLQELKEGEKMVGELVTITGIGQASVSKHLKAMSDAGLLARRKDGVRVYYHVADRMVFDLCELVCGKLNRDKESLSEVEYFI